MILVSEVLKVLLVLRDLSLLCSTVTTTRYGQRFLLVTGADG